jgi:hypothetical protein
MRKIALAAVLLLTAAACATGLSDDDGDAPAEPIAVHIADARVNGDVRYNGPIGFEFVVEITNSTEEAIRLRKIEINSADIGLVSVRASLPFNQEVAAGETARFDMSATGESAGGRLTSDEPITFRGRAFLDSSKGPLVKVFQAVVRP